MSWINVKSVTLTVTVASGAGSATFDEIGNLKTVAVLVPTADAAYAFDITDVDSYGIVGASGLVGNQTVEVDKLIVGAKHTFTISSATRDGEYTVRLWVRQGV